jgi:hypothetical protein
VVVVVMPCSLIHVSLDLDFLAADAAASYQWTSASRMASTAKRTVARPLRFRQRPRPWRLCRRANSRIARPVANVPISLISPMTVKSTAHVLRERANRQSRRHSRRQSAVPAMQRRVDKASTTGRRLHERCIRSANDSQPWLVKESSQAGPFPIAHSTHRDSPVHAIMIARFAAS